MIFKRRPRHVSIANILSVLPGIRHRLSDVLIRVVSNRICAEVLTSVLVLQVEILDLIFLKEVSALETLGHDRDFLGLSTLYITSVQVEIAAPRAHNRFGLLAKVSDQMRRAHQIVLLLQQIRW